MATKCRAADCNATQIEARGWCNACYTRWRRFGTTERQRRKKGTGTINGDGYHVVVIRGRAHRVHRLVWEAHRGPVPADMDVHHINRDPLDNRIENLALMKREEHGAYHGGQRWQRTTATR